MWREDVEILKAKLAVEQLDFMDPQHGKQKRYAAFKIQDVLDLAFGNQWRSGHWTEAVFNALDGYQAVTGAITCYNPVVFSPVPARSDLAR